MKKKHLISVLPVILLAISLLGSTLTQGQEEERWRFTIYTHTFSEPGSVEYELVEMTKEDWAEIGVNLEIVPIDGSTFWSMVFETNATYEEGGWDLGMAEYTNAPFEPYLTGKYDAPSPPWGPAPGVNFATWQNGLADYWLNLAEDTFDEDKRAHYYSEWQKVYTWDCPYIDLVTPILPFPMRADLTASFPGADPNYVVPYFVDDITVEGKTYDDYIEITAAYSGTDLGESQIPWFTTGGRFRQMNHFDGLIEHDIDENGEWVVRPSLAESWEIDEIQKTITFHLRQDVYWHDGVKFNATDVEWSYDVMMNPEAMTRAPRRLGHLDYEKGIDVIDEYTVRFYLKTLAPKMFEGFDMTWTPIGPWHFLKDIPVEELSQSNPMLWGEPIPGTGPWILTEISEDKTWCAYEANEDYFGKVPMIDRLIIRVIPEPTTVLIALQAGEIDFVANPYTSVQFIEDLENIEEQYPHLKVQYEVSCTHRCFYTNDLNRYLSNRLVRRALVMAIDREEIIDVVYNGHAAVFRTQITPGMKLYDPNIEPIPYDPEAAMEILDSVGLVMPPEPPELPDPMTTYMLPAAVGGLVVGALVGYVIRQARG